MKTINCGVRSCTSPKYASAQLAELPLDVITAPSVRIDLSADPHRLAETVRRSSRASPSSTRCAACIK